MQQKTPSGFTAYLRRGAKLLSNPPALKRLVVQAAKKLNGSSSEKIKAVGEQLGLLIDLLRAFIAGDYRDISNQAMISVVGAIIYFVVPLDGVPDFLFGWGFIDDAAVVSYVIAQISVELEVFKQWRDSASTQEQITTKSSDDDGQRSNKGLVEGDDYTIDD
jgi:uncharacterized membrane protein YkvA (DUF1232 family)